jgi:hypothetical protein
MSKDAEIRVFAESPDYYEWCKANDLDTDDDDNHNAFCEWKANQ